MSAPTKRPATIDDCLRLEMNIRARGLGNPYIASAGTRWNLFEQVERVGSEGRAERVLEPRLRHVTVERLCTHLEGISETHRFPMPTEVTP